MTSSVSTLKNMENLLGGNTHKKLGISLSYDTHRRFQHHHQHHSSQRSMFQSSTSNENQEDEVFTSSLSNYSSSHQGSGGAGGMFSTSRNSSFRRHRSWIHRSSALSTTPFRYSSVCVHMSGTPNLIGYSFHFVYFNFLYTMLYCVIGTNCLHIWNHFSKIFGKTFYFLLYVRRINEMRASQE